MDAIANNAIVKTLAQESPFDHGNEVMLFLYVWGVCDSNNKSKNIVSGAFLNLVRAFGALYLVVPIVLGKMPSALVADYDRYFQYFLGWWALTFFANRITGADTLNHKFFTFLKTVAYATFTGNACVTAFEQGSEAFSGSIFAPLLIGYLGVMGARVIENGLTAAVNGSSSEFDQDQILAVFGPLIFTFCTTGTLFGNAILGGGFVSALLARVFVVIFRLSAEHVDYNECIHFLQSIGDNITKTLNKGAKAVGKSIK